jgi:ATP-dependent DNA helicase RecG
MVSNYPYQAIRELLLNACMHRDMQSNTPLRFYEFAGHLEILNAGGLYGNARPENFPSVNDYRNPLVASAMKTLGYVNMFNRGVGQVQTDLKENGNLPAEFNVNLITAFKVDVKVSQSYTKENGGKTGGDIVENVVGKDLNDVEKPSGVVENVVENKGNVVENILASISKNSNISTKELAPMCSLSERQVQRIMAKLKKQGVIRRIGPDKGGHWEIIAP